MISIKRIEGLLREYARIRGPERLFTQETSKQLQESLAPVAEETYVLRADSARRYRTIWTVTAFAAAWLIAAILTLGPVETDIGLGLLVDGGFAREDLFRTMRGRPAAAPSDGGEFYVGVKLDRPSYVRILILNDHGLLEALELDRNGSAERRVGRDGDTFGGYELRAVDDLGLASTIQAFIVIASDRPLDDKAVAAWVDGQNQAAARGSRAPPERLARELRQRFGCAVRLVSP